MSEPLKLSAKQLTKCQLMEQNVDPTNFDDKKLPTDVHLIHYTLEGQKFVDAIRAYTMVDIFDAYHDAMDGKGEIHRIQAGFGHIKPNLYGKIKHSEDSE